MQPDAPDAAPDARLAEFLAAADGEAAREALGRLLEREASPLIWKVLRRQLGGAGAGTQVADLEDLHAELLLKIQLQLLAARRGERRAPESLLDYVAASAYNAAAGYQMARHPERTRLRDRLRYVLRRESTLASWSGRDRELVCGLARDVGRDAAPASDSRLTPLAATLATEHGGGWGRFPRLVVALLVALDRPCRLEELVAALAGALGIEEPVAAAIDDEPVEGPRGALLVDPAPAANERLAAVERVARVWSEIVDLPPNQRFALLVNLRGESGEALLEELLATGVVDRPALAAALGLAPTELAALLPELPRDDLWIAGRLALSRQQVINLRKSARLRLARRLRGTIDGVG
jgi:uncharacterized protein YfiM (DUF2279 family)